jgi:hypothetical protein
LRNRRKEKLSYEQNTGKRFQKDRLADFQDHLRVALLQKDCHDFGYVD